MDDKTLAVIQVQDGFIVFYRGGRWIADSDSEEAHKAAEVGNEMEKTASRERWLEEQPAAVAAKVGGKVLWTWLRKAEIVRLADEELRDKGLEIVDGEIVVIDQNRHRAAATEL